MLLSRSSSSCLSPPINSFSVFAHPVPFRPPKKKSFGKFTQLQFDGGFRMSGSGCTTYLLEKSRVVGHEPGERAYHVFYQASFFLLADSRLHIGSEEGRVRLAYGSRSDEMACAFYLDSRWSKSVTAQRYYLVIEACISAEVWRRYALARR